MALSRHTLPQIIHQYPAQAVPPSAVFGAQGGYRSACQKKIAPGLIWTDEQFGAGAPAWRNPNLYKYMDAFTTKLFPTIFSHGKKHCYM